MLLHVEIELKNRATVEPKLLRYHRGLSLKHGLAVHTSVLFLRGGPPGSRARVYEERSLGRMVGAVGYHSLGLSQAPAAEYLRRPEPLAWAFASLMRPRTGQSRSQLGLDCVVRIAEEPAVAKNDRRLLLGCVLTYADFEDGDAAEFDRIMDGLEDEEVRDVRMSMTERWRREGLEQGREQGKEQGKALGRAEGLRDLVIRILGQKFGSQSAEAQRRVGSITSVEELNRLAEKLYQVESLEELGIA